MRFGHREEPLVGRWDEPETSVKVSISSKAEPAISDVENFITLESPISFMWDALLSPLHYWRQQEMYVDELWLKIWSAAARLCATPLWILQVQPGSPIQSGVAQSLAAALQTGFSARSSPQSSERNQVTARGIAWIQLLTWSKPGSGRTVTSAPLLRRRSTDTSASS